MEALTDSIFARIVEYLLKQELFLENISWKYAINIPVHAPPANDKVKANSVCRFQKHKNCEFS